jgi:hypothetical protein
MDDFLAEVQEENVAGKIAWYNQQLLKIHTAPGAEEIHNIDMSDAFPAHVKFV